MTEPLRVLSLGAALDRVSEWLRAEHPYPSGAAFMDDLRVVMLLARRAGAAAHPDACHYGMGYGTGYEDGRAAATPRDHAGGEGT